MPLFYSSSLRSSPFEVLPTSVSCDGTKSCTTVRVSGEHDASNAEAFFQFLNSVLVDGSDNVILELSEVVFLSASTIGVIAEIGERLHSQGRSLRLRSPSPCVRRVLALCKLSHLLSESNELVTGPPSAPALESWVAVPPTSRVEKAVRLNEESPQFDKQEESPQFDKQFDHGRYRPRNLHGNCRSTLRNSTS